MANKIKTGKGRHKGENTHFSPGKSRAAAKIHGKYLMVESLICCCFASTKGRLFSLE